MHMLYSLSYAERKSTVGIECGKWECGLKKRGTPRDIPKITFYTWDFAGQVLMAVLFITILLLLQPNFFFFTFWPNSV